MQALEQLEDLRVIRRVDSDSVVPDQALGEVIGHMKAEGHLGRCYLKGREGDAANVILTAVGYNLRLVLAWLRILLRLFLIALCRPLAIPPKSKAAC